MGGESGLLVLLQLAEMTIGFKYQFNAPHSLLLNILIGQTKGNCSSFTDYLRGVPFTRLGLWLTIMADNSQNLLNLHCKMLVIDKKEILRKNTQMYCPLFTQHQ